MKLTHILSSFCILLFISTVEANAHSPFINQSCMLPSGSERSICLDYRSCEYFTNQFPVNVASPDTLREMEKHNENCGNDKLQNGLVCCPGWLGQEGSQFTNQSCMLPDEIKQSKCIAWETCKHFADQILHTATKMPSNATLIDMKRHNTACGGDPNSGLVCCPNNAMNPYASVSPSTETTSNVSSSPQQERISAIKCKEYGHLKTISKRSEDVSGPSFAVVNGTEAEPKEFPHMVAIGHKHSSIETVYTFFCGGSLISNNYVLTAAHCNKSSEVENYIVRLSSSSLNEGLDRQVKSFTAHANFKANEYHDDIALIRLLNPIRFHKAKSIRPACLWQSQKVGDVSLLATGWGKLGQYKDKADQLMKVMLDIMNSTHCEKINREVKFSSDSQVCAGVMSGYRDTCVGDSGGPLQYIQQKENQNTTFIVGITSYGYTACGMNKSAAVYTRVSAYLDWIEEIVWSQ